MFDGIWTQLSGSEQAGQSLEQRTKRGAFAGKPMIIGWLAMLIFAFYACTHMVAAGDTWVAMACGRYFFNHGVNTVEPFSANAHEPGPTEAEVADWPDWARKVTDVVGLKTVRYWHPTGWINQNWLTHVIFYWLTTRLGSEAQPYYDALIWWKFAVYFLAAGCLYATTRLLGINRLLSVVSICFAMLIARTFLDVRPAGFSNLLVPVFLFVLALASYRNALYIWLIVPIVVFWSNVHGGYIYAFIAMVPFVCWHVMMKLPKRWTIAVYSILTWAVLAFLANQFWNELVPMTERLPSYDRIDPISFTKDWVFYLLVIAAASSIALAAYRRVDDGVIAVFHIAVSAILFILFLTRFFPQVPSVLSDRQQKAFIEVVKGGRMGYLGLSSVALILGAVVTALKDRVVIAMEWKGILHTVGAGAVAFVAMVIFNPFHLTNLTHTYIISISSSAERWRDVHEWHRAFDWANPVGTAIPFMVMYIIAWVALVVWAVASIRCAGLMKPTAQKQAATGEFTWPRIDVALVVLAAMTIYMAIRSRRFIPIAAFAACPVIALLIEQIVTYTLTLVRMMRRGQTLGDRLSPAVGLAIVLALGVALVVLAFWRVALWNWLFLPVPGTVGLVRPRFWLAALGTILAFAAFPAAAVLLAYREPTDGQAKPATHDWGRYLRSAAAVSLILLAGSALGFGIWVGAKFKEVYLDYWPSDPKLTSVFMRMTASDAKPFEACQFIRDNKLSGNMFNYWTEGGAIAWGQTPDPNTGRTPLQLFMDGRAQAAYSQRVFDLWSDIISGGGIWGGPILDASNAGRGRGAGKKPLTVADYTAIGDWAAKQLVKYDVWITLMPSGEFRSPFVLGLDFSPAWQIVFANNRQRLYVNINTQKGRQLFDDVVNGRAKFPNDFTANYTRGHNLTMYADTEHRNDGYEMIIKAFDECPSRAPMQDILDFGLRVPELRARMIEVCQAFADKFEQDRAQYAHHDGYNLPLAAATMAVAELADIAQRLGNAEEAATYTDRAAQYDLEARRIANTKRW